MHHGEVDFGKEEHAKGRVRPDDVVKEALQSAAKMHRLEGSLAEDRCIEEVPHVIVYKVGAIFLM